MAAGEKKQSRVLKFLRDLKSEGKKVTWPTMEETKKRTFVVIVELVIVAVVVGILDFGFSKLILLLAGIV